MKLIIHNKTYNIIEAKSFSKKFIGLMGKKGFNYGMLFYKINSIHTFFMKETIDVIAIDENNIIIDIKKSLKKNHIYIAHNKAKKTSILELPNNASNTLNIGDKLTFISK